MTTALQIISRSLTDIRVIGAGDAPTADDADLCLAYLKDVMQSWDNESLMVFGDGYAAFAGDGSQSYFIGSGQTIDVLVPEKITRLYYQSGGVDYELDEITADQYWAIPDKTVTGTPDRYFIYYNPSGASYHSIYPYPRPSSGPFGVFYLRPVYDPAMTLTTVFELPNGYERALRLALNVEIMPAFKKNDPMLIQMAEKAKRDIKNMNASNRVPAVGLGLPNLNTGGGNILNGGYP